MKKIVLLIILIVGIAEFFIYLKPAKADFNLAFFQSACEKPVTYKIGTIDPQFNVSQKVFKDSIARAALIWSKSYGKSLFLFDQASDLKINLIYDARQQNFDQTKNISDQVKNLGGQVDQLGNQLSQNKKSLEPEIQAYQKRVQAFNQRVQKLNSDIEYWNNKGGAPQEEYDRINKERDSLKQEADSLNKTADQLNQQKQQFNSEVDKFNSQLGTLNQKTGQLNQSIETLHTTVQNKPEEGLYDPKLQTIDIYFNIDQQELAQTLAHELGHARGLGHNQNPKSIMYPFTNKQATPSADDMKDLNEICRTKSLPEIAYQRFQVILNYYQQLLQNYLVKT